MPIGYIPARKKPVPKRTKKMISFVKFSRSKLLLHKAPKIAQIKNTLEGENRSAINKVAKSKVPVINPNCTEDKI